MSRRSTIFAWVAAAGVLLHVGTAGASIWCQAMGLMAAPCCPAELESTLSAPSDCCRPSLETPRMGAAELAFTLDADLVAFPWDKILPGPVRTSIRADAPTATSTSPPLESLSTIVINC